MAKSEELARPGLIAGSPATAPAPREFLDGSRRSEITLDTMRIGHGTYLPGWRWSLHAGPQTGKPSARHVGYVLSGRMIIRSAAGDERELGPGDAFEAGPGHDAWVVGDEPCTALDFTPIADGRPPNRGR